MSSEAVSTFGRLDATYANLGQRIPCQESLRALQLPAHRLAVTKCVYPMVVLASTCRRRSVERPSLRAASPATHPSRFCRMPCCRANISNPHRRRQCRHHSALPEFLCHLQVERFGGTGMVEIETGLPIGSRSFKCQHASAGGMARHGPEDDRSRFLRPELQGL